MMTVLSIPQANADDFNWKKKQQRQNQQNQSQSTQDSSVSQGAIPAGQIDIVNAQNSGRGLQFVEVKDVQVVRVLPDDTKGSRHEKWIVRLANGRDLMAVYNTSICEYVPLQVGDTVSMGGQYIYERGGGLIHWLHEDPKNRRPDGYVDLNGKRYGKFSGDGQAAE